MRVMIRTFVIVRFASFTELLLVILSMLEPPVFIQQAFIVQPSWISR